MAPETEVKKYIACWMQLGAKVSFQDGQRVQIEKVLQGEQYSPEFEALWRSICDRPVADACLDGTTTALHDLMEGRWEITSCARCEMPIATMTAGIQPLDCPCQDLTNWPNTELPTPRPPVISSDRLKGIQDRLSTSSFD